MSQEFEDAIHKAVRKHFEVREKMFDVNDFSREAIAEESYKIGAEFGYNHAKSESQWQPIKTAPKNGTLIILGLWVKSIKRPIRFDQYILSYSEEFGCLYDTDGDAFTCWELEDFRYWMALPEPPKGTK